MVRRLRENVDLHMAGIRLPVLAGQLAMAGQMIQGRQFGVRGMRQNYSGSTNELFSARDRTVLRTESDWREGESCTQSLGQSARNASDELPYRAGTSGEGSYTDDAEYLGILGILGILGKGAVQD